MGNKEQIRERAFALLAESQAGIRYSDLVRQIHDALPEIPINTIHGTVWNLDATASDKVFKPSRGLFLHVKYREAWQQPSPGPKAKIKESDFYKPFADWIVNELEECTKAIPVGGNTFKDRWGTPDVVGIREPRKSDIVKLPTEIISAEIKIDSNNLITAFGQACSYRLFSHKSYIVVPSASPEEEKARLDSLCRIFGIGLILFNSEDPKDPGFEIRVRATKYDPDMFYVNRYMRLIEDKLFS